ncbi:MAG: rod shape-determining protein RodA [Leptospirales bacterium]|nr:rod shape-determining protein RodA [Leptospirales bacterium]
MDQLRRIDWIFFGAAAAITIAGIFTLYAQESILEEPPGRWYRQLIFFGLALIVCFAIRRVNYQVLGGLALPLYGIGIFLLLLTMIIGDESKGARSWIRFGWFGFQSSEIAKLATVLLLAKYLELKERELNKLQSLVIPAGIALLPMLLIVVQPDLGGAVSIAPILFLMLFLAGADIYHIGSVVVLGAVATLIPLYVEYHKITLVSPLLDRLSSLGAESLLPAVRILKTDIWRFVSDGAIPAGIAEQDRSYLTNLLGNGALMQSLRDAADTVRFESGGVLLLALENTTLLVILGAIFAVIALALFVVRMTQGQSMARLRKAYIPLGVLGVALLAAATFQTTLSFKYHQIARITAFVNPDQFPRDLAYQIRASKAAIGSGELTGRGFFQGDMTVGARPLVPEAFTDFIFTAWAERTGFLGSVLMLALLFLIPLRALQVSFESRDRFGALLAGGLAAMYFHHMAFNAGIALGLLPVTGLPLSFMSYGGSHLLVSYAGAGMLLSIFRRRFAN